jgi:hypothetical protein
MSANRSEHEIALHKTMQIVRQIAHVDRKVCSAVTIYAVFDFMTHQPICAGGYELRQVPIGNRLVVQNDGRRRRLSFGMFFKCGGMVRTAAYFCRVKSSSQNPFEMLDKPALFHEGREDIVFRDSRYRL